MSFDLIRLESSSTGIKPVVFEYESEAFIPVWLTQDQLKYTVEDVDDREIYPILYKPRVFVLQHHRTADLAEIQATLVSGSYNGTTIEQEDIILNFKQFKGPKASAVFLNPSGYHGNCHLSKKDVVLLEYVQNCGLSLNNTTYIVQKSRRSSKYDIYDLDDICKNIQKIVYGSTFPNKIFGQLFFLGDKQIPVRIGLCLQNSLRSYLVEISSKIQTKTEDLSQQMKELNNLQKPLVRLLKKEFRTNSHKTKSVANHVEVLIETVTKYLMSKKIESTSDSLCELKDIFYKELSTFTKQRKQAVEERSTKHIACCTKRKLRSSRKENVLEQKLPSYKFTTISLKSKTFAEILSDVSITVFQRVFCRKRELLSKLIDQIQDEIAKINQVLPVHVWKTVSERHSSISGFGFMNGEIGIYLKEDCQDNKKNVRQFLDKYLDTSEFKFKIEYSRRKIRLFSRIEQGSRINKTKTSGTGPKDYGTLGMFLHDNNGTYFFTTCAHVIEANQFAYAPEDSSRLGVNVLTLSTDEPYKKPIDFSLIRVCPENELSCTFGLKTSAGKFINGSIFTGDVSEVLHRTLYKWGATEPYMTKGKCIGFDEHSCYILLEIDKKDFAQPGDSGSMICVGENKQNGIAAFVFVGVCSDYPENPSKVTYAVYKISDALAKVAEMRKEIKPCFVPQTKTIRISSTIH